MATTVVAATFAQLRFVVARHAGSLARMPKYASLKPAKHK